MGEICDEFAGDWRLVKVHGYTQEELDAGGPAYVTFWEDGSGDLSCAGVTTSLEVEYGETLEGLAAVQFKAQRPKGQGRGRVSGLGAIADHAVTLEGSLTIGGRARAFVAKRL